MFDLPPLPNPDWCAATSSTGASVVLPLRPDAVPAGGYLFEFVMFGGHSSRSNTFPDPTNPANIIQWGESLVSLGSHARPIT